MAHTRENQRDLVGLRTAAVTEAARGRVGGRRVTTTQFAAQAAVAAVVAVGSLTGCSPGAAPNSSVSTYQSVTGGQMAPGKATFGINLDGCTMVSLDGDAAGMAAAFPHGTTLNGATVTLPNRNTIELGKEAEIKGQKAKPDNVTGLTMTEVCRKSEAELYLVAED